MKHQQSSVYVDLQQYQLHVRRLIPLQGALSPVLYLHGAIENGRIFYSNSGKGLACYLADQGFIGYCADFAGRGLSQPSLSTGFNQSQHQVITRDIPALIEFVYQQHQQPLTVIAHSWGGVLLAASLARFPELLCKVRAKVYFGTKRVISVRSLERKIKIDWLWSRFAPWLGRKYGYIPARKWGFGADNEPTEFLTDTINWINGAPFADLTDGFDYAAASQQTDWPPSWHFAAVNDTVLGHPVDVQHFINETGQQDGKYILLGRAAGYLHDYDHISMLTHPKATEDHFIQLNQWLVDLPESAEHSGQAAAT
ncbi:alpha/beta fold hydrolase [Arsukibacterium sp.]|uniref:alpha/beta fold hydrolase n=1 Tax=Arsukibacterium sp. TaxID=1977258 RepID=UPI00299E624A|nr:alpha/beta fold hydrolase [Arsukibacterium sp.]MDX1536671.1 alpha/beta fold hydrolase [Arsukibacterium sp.]